MKKYTIGIDAVNIRRGGGVTHMIELINSIDDSLASEVSIVICGGDDFLSKIEEKSCIKKISNKMINGNIFERTIWQKYYMSNILRKEECDVLFVPGGAFYGDFETTVLMSQNLLPFEFVELFRYGFSLMTLKMLILRYLQINSFKKARGIIYLTEYAKNVVTKAIGSQKIPSVTIPHGINLRFDFAPRPQFDLSMYNDDRVYNILYVSIVEPYKHQWNLIEAVYALREKGYSIKLNLVGPFYGPSLKKMNSYINKYDKNAEWVEYYGTVPYDEMHNIYKKSDLGVFASSCENMPIILIEMMAAGLPIACSEMGPMPEVLLDGGVYFNPNNSESIEKNIRILLDEPAMRGEMAKKSYEYSKRYSWKRSANSTIDYLIKMAGSAGLYNEDSNFR